MKQLKTKIYILLLFLLQLSYASGSEALLPTTKNTTEEFVLSIHKQHTVNKAGNKLSDLTIDILAKPQLLTKFVEKPELVEAWKVLFELSPTAPKRLSTEMLEVVSKHIGDTDFLKVIGNNDITVGKTKFGELINTYNGSCNGCGGNPSDFLPDNPNQFFDKLSAHIKTYKNKNGVSLFNEAKKGRYSQEGLWFAMKKLDNIDQSTIKRLDATFENLPDDICNNCRFDIELFNGTKLEFKSWGEVGVNLIASRQPQHSFYRQFAAYLSDASTTNISKIEYYFDIRKLSGISNPENYIKGKFKTFFKNNAPEIFNTNPDLFKQFDKIGGGKIEDFADFETLINHSSFTTNHPMFNFIKVE